MSWPAVLQSRGRTRRRGAGGARDQTTWCEPRQRCRGSWRSHELNLTRHRNVWCAHVNPQVSGDMLKRGLIAIVLVGGCGEHQAAAPAVSNATPPVVAAKRACVARVADFKAFLRRNHDAA